MRPLASLCVCVLGSLLGCAAVSDDLRRAQYRYEQAEYEEALIWLEALERDTPDMDGDERARFYYLRGMAAYRLDNRHDALHYLALAREVAEQHSTGLRPEWRTGMDRTLAELTPRDATLRAGGDDAQDRVAEDEGVVPASAAEQR